VLARLNVIFIWLHCEMDIIRNKLSEIGFVLEKIPIEYFQDYIYKWECSVYRDATYYVWITSSPFWHFTIERAKSPHETGIEGYSRYVAFKGIISSNTALSDLDVLLRTTGVYSSMQEGKNELKV
jgi:hypothetical protein